MDQLSSHFFCAPQISPDDIQAAKAQGVTAVVCQRPDNEEPGQPACDTVAQWCRDAGMVFVFLPVLPGQIGAEHVAEFRRLTAGHDKLLGYCRTGTRAAILWAANEVALGRLSADEAEHIVAGSGRHIGAARALLNSLAASGSAAAAQ